MKFPTAMSISPLLALAILGATGAKTQEAGPTAMSFFVTSAGPGKGGDLGGIEGADRHCQSLADAAGGRKTWRAYLSTQGPNAVNARDRIGRGPWSNAKGVVIAKDAAELHGANKLAKQTALTEKRAVVTGVSPACRAKLRQGAQCEPQNPCTIS